MATPVTIIIPAFNQLDYCKLCIDSIQRNATYPYKLVLVDNGSTDGVSEYFDSVPGAIVVHSEENLGFAGGVNLGLAHAEGHAILLNSDTIVTPGWIERLVNALEADDAVGMVGPVTNYASGPQYLEGIEIESFKAIDPFAEERASTHAGQTLDVKGLVGFCLVIRDAVLEKVGAFDERFGIGNFEDDDYSRRVREAGYTMRVVQDCFIFHFGHRTFQGMGIVGDAWETLMESNAQVYSEKWDEPLAERYAQLKAAAALHREAIACTESADWAGALAKLLACLQKDPTYHHAHNDLGAVLWELGEHEKAYASFARAVRLFPTYEAARNNLRDAAEALGRVDDAAKILCGGGA